MKQLWLTVQHYAIEFWQECHPACRAFIIAVVLGSVVIAIL
jgi:hypothetical protein